MQIVGGGAQLHVQGQRHVGGYGLTIGAHHRIDGQVQAGCGADPGRDGQRIVGIEAVDLLKDDVQFVGLGLRPGSRS